MIKPGKIFLLLLSMTYCASCFSQEEAPSIACEPIVKAGKNNRSDINRLVDLIKSKDLLQCRWNDQKSGFAKKTDSLMKITTLQEKQELFNDSSTILRYYLFPAILYENDSLAFELLTKDINDSAELVAFCACMIDDTPINLRLLNFYYSFIWLKYQNGYGGTIEGFAFSFKHGNKSVRDNKKWKQKVTDLKNLMAHNTPAYELEKPGSWALKRK